MEKAEKEKRLMGALVKEPQIQETKYAGFILV